MGWLGRWREAKAEVAVRRLERERLRDWLSQPPQIAALEPAGHDVALVDNLAALLAECDRADKMAGSRGGFVATTRIRQLLGGES